jgi:hypothetical protein
MSPIRDLLLVATLFALVPVSFLRPWIGVLAWFWVAYFVPQEAPPPDRQRALSWIVHDPHDHEHCSRL